MVIDDFLDCSNPGMRSFLKGVEAQTEELKNEWMQMIKDKCGAKVTEDSVQVWRAFKSLTWGEARKVIMIVKNEDGFKAWQKLHMHFGPSLSAKQGMALADFSGMVSKPATKPGETKSLITELERRMKMVGEVKGELISDNHAKSVAETFNEEQGQEHTRGDPAAWTRPGTGEQYVNTFGNGASQCHNCQGNGHLAREVSLQGQRQRIR